MYAGAVLCQMAGPAVQCTEHNCGKSAGPRIQIRDLNVCVKGLKRRLEMLRNWDALAGWHCCKSVHPHEPPLLTDLTSCTLIRHAPAAEAHPQ